MNNQRPSNKQVPSDGNQVKNQTTGTKNTNVAIGGDNRGNVTINNFNFPAVASIFLAAISLLADLLAFSQLAYNIIVKNEITNINTIYQFIAIILVFSLGYGLGILGMRGFKEINIDKVLQIYVWGYLVLACLSYFGIITTFRFVYTFGSYVTYIIIIALQITAFMVLKSASQVKSEIAHAIPLMTVSVIHALIFLYNIIYVKIPGLFPLLGEWLFWFGWTMYAVPMFRSAFTSRSAIGTSRSKFR